MHHHRSLARCLRRRRIVCPRRSIDSIQNSLISRLLRKALIPHQRRALGREHARNPRVLITHTPQRNAHTPRRIHTAPHQPRIRIRLRRELLRRRRRVHAHVELSVRHVHAEVRVQAQHALEHVLRGRGRRLRAGRLGGHVALQADAVDLLAVGLHELHDARGAESFGGRGAVLEVVVVVVELRGGVGGRGEAEGDGDVGFADGAEEDVVSVCAVLVESCSGLAVDTWMGCQWGSADSRDRRLHTLVDDVPVSTCARIATHHRINVRLHNTNQRGVIKPARRHPRWELAVPDQRMATNLVAVGCREVHNCVRAVESEGPLGRLGRLPFHGIFRSDGVELGRDNTLLGCVAAEGERCAGILLALGLYGSVEDRGSLAGSVELWE